MPHHLLIFKLQKYGYLQPMQEDGKDRGEFVGGFNTLWWAVRDVWDDGGWLQLSSAMLRVGCLEHPSCGMHAAHPCVGTPPGRACREWACRVWSLTCRGWACHAPESFAMGAMGPRSPTRALGAMGNTTQAHHKHQARPPPFSYVQHKMRSI